jgi:hypothetical protein
MRVPLVDSGGKCDEGGPALQHRRVASIYLPDASRPALPLPLSGSVKPFNTVSLKAAASIWDGMFDPVPSHVEQIVRCEDVLVERFEPSSGGRAR